MLQDSLVRKDSEATPDHPGLLVKPDRAECRELPESKARPALPVQPVLPDFLVTGDSLELLD